MKKKFVFLIGVFVLVLVVGGLWSLSSRQLASPSLTAGLFFAQSTLGSASGDAFYDERCIDVSQYLSQGYGVIRTDEYGCQIVGICTWVHVATASYTSLGDDARRDRCGGLDYDIYRDSSGSLKLDCGYTVCQEKGGFERVLNYCTYDQNDLLVAETFAGGQTITKMSLRYPMKSFCRAHPSIVTNDALKTSVTSTNIPQTLIDGGSVAIASGETLTVFYIIENNANLPTICSSTNNLALDVDNPTLCKSTLGFTYLCSEGQFDALTGTCVVQPESKTLCSQGRYDVGLGLCVYNPPLQVDCGANDCFYSVDRDVCSCVVGEEFQCAEGFTLSQPSNALECVDEGGDWLDCPQCPVDKVCSTDVCTARCSIGQKCVWSNPMVTDCQDANATIRNGECVINGTVIVLCPDNSEYNRETELCEFRASVVDVCPNGSSMITNALTGVKECIANVESFTDCPADEIFSNGRCVKQITVYVPQTNEVVIYKEIDKGCTADSDCEKIDSSFKCNVANGVCQTPIYYKTNYTPIYISAGIVLVGGILLFLFRKKRGRKR